VRLSARPLADWLRRWRAAGSHQPSAGRLLEQAISAYRAREWSASEPLFQAVIGATIASAVDRQVARNLLAAQYVRTRRLSEAIDLFEANVAEGFGGGYPYERLAEIYARQRQFEAAVRVLRRAIAVIGAGPASLGGRETRLARLQAALAEIEANRPSAEPEPG
jgi:hypothetical protein